MDKCLNSSTGPAPFRDLKRVSTKQLSYRAYKTLVSGMAAGSAIRELAATCFVVSMT